MSARRGFRIHVVMERRCPFCRRGFEASKHFRALLRRPETRVYALDSEHDTHEVQALWVGLSESERLAWAGGALRGTAKTPAVIVDDGAWPRVLMPLAAEDEFSFYERIASAVTPHAPFPPLVREPREEREKRKGGRGG